MLLALGCVTAAVRCTPSFASAVLWAAWMSESPSHEGYFQRLFAPENIPNIGLLIAGIVGIVVAIATLNHMRESSERQLQAYVLPENATIVEGLMLTPPKAQMTNVPGVAMLIKNCGQTPAYQVVSYAQIAVISVANENTMLVIPQIPKQFSNTLGPGSTFNSVVV